MLCQRLLQGRFHLRSNQEEFSSQLQKPFMLSITECIRWTGITIFEIWLHAVGLLIFSVLIVMKTEIYSSLTYWHVFTPLFVVTALNLYFLFIVLIRTVVEEKQCKDPILNRSMIDHLQKYLDDFRHAFSWLRLVMIGIFEALLCYKVNGDLEDGQVAVQSSYGIVFLPIWVLMAALCFQAFRFWKINRNTNCFKEGRMLIKIRHGSIKKDFVDYAWIVYSTMSYVFQD
uniref:Bm5235 n=1 Tax=Elaeophora elaphi TaxID=1147741 RepID=A0A0R3S177_9BILA